MIDQQHVLSESVGGSVTHQVYEIGQTFTVGMGGLLTRVELGVGKVGAPGGDLLLDIRSVAQDVPADEIPLLQLVVPKAQIPQRASNGLTPVTAIEVAAGGIVVAPGDKLAIVLSSDQAYDLANSIVWDRGFPGYASGKAGERTGTQAWTLDNTYDFAFRTWVDPTPSLSGDFNGDLAVDALDYSVWSSTYGSTTDLRADANGDLLVDAADYTVWRDNLSAVPAVSFAPEPAAVTLLALTLIALCRNRPAAPRREGAGLPDWPGVFTSFVPRRPD